MVILVEKEIVLFRGLEIFALPLDQTTSLNVCAANLSVQGRVAVL
jgi:hypothetical protein